MSRLGTGRVWSEMIMTQFRFPFASSERRGESIGCSIASRTIALPLPAAFSSPMELVSTAAPFSSKSIMVLPYGMCTMAQPLSFPMSISHTSSMSPTKP